MLSGCLPSGSWCFAGRPRPFLCLAFGRGFAVPGPGLLLGVPGFCHARFCFCNPVSVWQAPTQEPIFRGLPRYWLRYGTEDCCREWDQAEPLADKGCYVSLRPVVSTPSSTPTHPTQVDPRLLDEVLVVKPPCGGGGNSVCGRAIQRGRCRTKSRRASPQFGTREFFGRRLQTSMARATVEESTAGLGQTLRGTSSVWWVTLPCRLGVHEFTGSGREKAADAGLGLLLWVTTAIHTPWVAVWRAGCCPRHPLSGVVAFGERRRSSSPRARRLQCEQTKIKK